GFSAGAGVARRQDRPTRDSRTVLAKHCLRRTGDLGWDAFVADRVAGKAGRRADCHVHLSTNSIFYDAGDAGARGRAAVFSAVDCAGSAVFWAAHRDEWESRCLGLGWFGVDCYTVDLREALFYAVF